MKRRLTTALLCLLLLSITVSSAFTENLKMGAESGQVRQAQVRLRQLGFYKGDTDGKFGYSTSQAVMAFQKKNSLMADGVIGENTVAKLYSTAANKSAGGKGGAYSLRVSYGSQGPAVSLTQKRLRTLKYYSDTVEGKFGYATFQAVKAFQDKNGLTVDGVVGPKTWSKLLSNKAIASNGKIPATPGISPSMRIKSGQTGQLVIQLQTQLKKLKYYKSTVDGKFGFGTYKAVLDFQRHNKIKADGIVGPATWKKLFDASAVAKPALAFNVSKVHLKFGDTGAKVKEAQTRLRSLGYYTRKLDARYGGDTVKAVRSFQLKNGLKVDGVIGPSTWTRLFSAKAIHK